MRRTFAGALAVSSGERTRDRVAGDRQQCLIPLTSSSTATAAARPHARMALARSSGTRAGTSPLCDLTVHDVTAIAQGSGDVVQVSRQPLSVVRAVMTCLQVVDREPERHDHTSCHRRQPAPVRAHRALADFGAAPLTPASGGSGAPISSRTRRSQAGQVGSSQAKLRNVNGDLLAAVRHQLSPVREPFRHGMPSRVARSPIVRARPTTHRSDPGGRLVTRLYRLLCCHVMNFGALVPAEHARVRTQHAPGTHPPAVHWMTPQVRAIMDACRRSPTGPGTKPHCSAERCASRSTNSRRDSACTPERSTSGRRGRTASRQARRARPSSIPLFNGLTTP